MQHGIVMFASWMFYQLDRDLVYSVWTVMHHGMVILHHGMVMYCIMEWSCFQLDRALGWLSLWSMVVDMFMLWSSVFWCT